ncbi:MAG: PRC-barrel domain-containing protein [Candidatus Thermoplasmatota archaeon]|jgi:sporulation protein YlmC with PRC-barrel domain|nr:PRC-barrel domain-containing protein [Candidatus Thermoplasmatota archaeon]
MRMFSSDLTGRSVVTTDGVIIGQVNNIVVETETGFIKSLLTEPKGELKLTVFQKDSKGRYMIPLDAIKSFKDVLVLDPRSLVKDESLTRV